MLTEDRRRYMREYYARRRREDSAFAERVRELARKSYARHRERIRLRRRQTESEEQRAKRRVLTAAWKVANRERVRSYMAAYLPTYLQQNRERLNDWRRGYHARRYRMNPQYRLAHVLRARLKALVDKGKLPRGGGALRLVGCSLKVLRMHLESLFISGMTWENYGTWEIDHVRPCAAFDLTDPAQQAACSHYTNLQPLWAVDNRRKGAKVG